MKLSLAAVLSIASLSSIILTVKAGPLPVVDVGLQTTSCLDTECEGKTCRRPLVIYLVLIVDNRTIHQ